MGVAHICHQAGHAAKLTKTIYPHLGDVLIQLIL
jgi:hypothetical protein